MGVRRIRLISICISLATLLSFKLHPNVYTHAARIMLLLAGALGAGFVFARSALSLAVSRASGRSWAEAVDAAVPASVQRLLTMEVMVYREGLCTLTGRLPPSVRRMRAIEGGERFSAGAGSFSSVFVPLVVVASFVDTPLLHLVIQSQVAPSQRFGWHLALLAATACGVIWAIGDRAAVKRMRHVVTRDDVHLNAGFRRNLRIPRDAVVGAAVQRLSLRDTLRSSYEAEEVLTVIHMDPPNVLLSLEGARPLARIAPAVRVLAVYCDQPEAFVDCLKRHDAH